MNPFHAWLIKQRIYCERCDGLTKATHIREFNGKYLIVCSEHARRLDAVRQSEKQQTQQTKNPK